MEEPRSAQSKATHVAILPSPGMGHLIPLVEFGKRLVHLQHSCINVTFIIPTDGPPTKAQRSVLASLPTSINHVFLPPVDLDDVPVGAKIETIVSVTVARSLPSLRDVLKSLAETTNLAAVVVDLFGTDAFAVAREFNASPYIFFPSTAMALSLFFYLPKLDQMVSCEYRDHPELVSIPGCIPIHGKDLLNPVQDRKNEAYKWLLHHVKRYPMADGIMANSFLELEPGAVKFLLAEEPGKPTIYPVGPLVNMGLSVKVEGSHECLQWLDEQPHGSVLFISFGSGGTLSLEQITELALGLESSEQRFLWVVRSPNDEDSSASFFTVKSRKNPLDFLPKGFVERTKGRGFLIPSWAPQAQVLSHGSTGGFLTHCGWNSTLESVVNGIPLIAWPLYAEQKMNAIMLTKDIKVALRPKQNEKGIVVREEIARIAKALMEGEEGKGVRSRMKDLKDAASKALSQDGSSTKALSELALKWKNKKY